MSVADRIALAGALLIFGALPGFAQEAGRYDRKIERATAARVAEKLGELRGPIRPDVKNYLYSENALPSAPVPGFPIIREPRIEAERSNLPPLVMIVPMDDLPQPPGPPYRNWL